MIIFKKNSKIIFVIILMILLKSVKIYSQDTVQKNILSVYIDCYDCDMKFIKDEIKFVNHVREVKDAQVYILITSQETGSGGNEKTIFISGQNDLNYLSDTIRFYNQADDTEGIIREKLVKLVKLGLVPFILERSSYGNIDLVYKQEEKNETIVDDNWNDWVYNIDLGGLIQGEQSYKSLELWSTIRADKVVEDYKLRFRLSSIYDESSFNLSNGWFKNISRDYSFYHLYVKSLGDHWSVGESINAKSATYSNIDYSLSFYPTIEYNLFPWSMSTRKQLTFYYNVGLSYNNYTEMTIYNKEKEGLLNQKLIIAVDMIEKWGSVSLSVRGSNYFHDFSLNNLRLYGSMSVRVIKGLSLVLSGYSTLIHDQIALPSQGASEEELLLRIKEIETSYNYYLNFGITYSFGATYNNIVNSRFE